MGIEQFKKKISINLARQHELYVSGDPTDEKEIDTIEKDNKVLKKLVDKESAKMKKKIDAEMKKLRKI